MVYFCEKWVLPIFTWKFQQHCHLSMVHFEDKGGEVSGEGERRKWAAATPGVRPSPAGIPLPHACVPSIWHRVSAWDTVCTQTWTGAHVQEEKAHRFWNWHDHSRTTSGLCSNLAPDDLLEVRVCVNSCSSHCPSKFAISMPPFSALIYLLSINLCVYRRKERWSIESGYKEKFVGIALCLHVVLILGRESMGERSLDTLVCCFSVRKDWGGRDRVPGTWAITCCLQDSC